MAIVHARNILNLATTQNWHSKLQLMVIGFTVAVVNYYAMKMATICSAMMGLFVTAKNCSG